MPACIACRLCFTTCIPVTSHAVFTCQLPVPSFFPSVDLLRLGFLNHRLPNVDSVQRPVEVESRGDEGDVGECLGGVLDSVSSFVRIVLGFPEKTYAQSLSPCANLFTEERNI
jgi:hypothetical protein